ncbi:MAG: hypothetical protein JST55_14935 [Bacteroidetes bacterium]|nr:hypothetical protein [Bacteroidota bacterium]
MKQLSLIGLLIVFFTAQAYSQSRYDLEKQYAVYKKNKVKTETIIYSDGSKTISKYDKKGRPTEIINYDNGKESYSTTFKYNSKGLLESESYFGYETGDGVTNEFTYDDNGFMIKSVASGSQEDITYYENDSQGNAVKITYYNKGSNNPAGELNYKMTYSGDLLISIETRCKPGDESALGTRYTYDGANLIINEDYDKDCKTGKETFSSKKTFEYFDNGLIKETGYQSTYSEGVRKGSYSYETY